MTTRRPDDHEDQHDGPRGSVFPGFAEVGNGSGNLVRSLAAVRRSRGLSQTEVAATMGTSQSAVARLESGTADARLSTLERYAAALQVRVGFGLSAYDSDHDDRTAAR